MTQMCILGHVLRTDIFLEPADSDKGSTERKSAAASSQVDCAEVRQIMDAVKSLLNEKYVSSVGGIFVFKLKG